MKKPSFFERLAGNLRFDDTDDVAEVKTPEPKKEEYRSITPSQPLATSEKRELFINTEPVVAEKKVVPEEVGELPVDLYETPNELIIQTLIAGVLPENLSIDITRDIVTISGRREESKGIPNDSYHIHELYWGAFERVVELPEEVEIDTAEAIERHGMLIIKLPKVDKRRRTLLKIKSI
jgi:HSP20 family protein